MKKIKILPFDSDEHIYVIIGDCVVTKYGETLTIESYDEENDQFTFEEYDKQTGKKYQYQSHRISHLISKRDYLLEKIHNKMYDHYKKYDKTVEKLKEVLDIKENDYFSHESNKKHRIEDVYSLNFSEAKNILLEMKIKFDSYQKAVKEYQEEKVIIEEKYPCENNKFKF